VRPATDRELDVVFPGDPDGTGHVDTTGRPDDDRRVPVDEPVPDVPTVLVVLVVREDELSTQVLLEIYDRSPPGRRRCPAGDSGLS
jgi:hypothetical protein